MWTDYVTCMRRVGFNWTTPLYVASGLFSYDSPKGTFHTTACSKRLEYSYALDNHMSKMRNIDPADTSV